MRAFSGRSLGLCALGLCGACSGPSVGDIVGQEVTVSLTSVSSDGQIAVAGDSQGGLGVSRAFLSVSALGLVPCRSDAGEVVTEARGYELLSAPPQGERVSTAVTELCGLRLDVDPLSRVEADGVPDGAALYVAATDAAGNALAFSSTGSSSITFTAQGDDSFGDQPLLIGFDLAKWLAGLPLPPGFTKSESAQLLSQLPDSAALYVDANGNGLLDADEQTPVAQGAASR